MAEQEQNVNSNNKLIESIKKFVASYKALSPAGKNAFQNQINGQIKNMDTRTKKLYETLIAATKDDLSTEKIIKEMERADKESKHGI